MSEKKSPPPPPVPPPKPKPTVSMDGYSVGFKKLPENKPKK